MSDEAPRPSPRAINGDAIAAGAGAPGSIHY